MGASMFGPRHVGMWVSLKLVGGHEMTARIVDVSLNKTEVRERAAESTWNIPDKSIAAWQLIAEPADVAGDAA